MSANSSTTCGVGRNHWRLTAATATARPETIVQQDKTESGKRVKLEQLCTSFHTTNFTTNLGGGGQILFTRRVRYT